MVRSHHDSYSITERQERLFVRAFTLIELLIVVAIIGILAAIAVPSFQNAMIRAKVTEVQATMRSMETVIEQYRLDRTQLPLHFNTGEQNYWMTTPIAYASERPYDSFQDFKGGAERAAWSVYSLNDSKGCPHYHFIYTDRTFLFQLLGPDFQESPYYDQAAGGGYVFMTIGPDLHWSNVPYEVSNGLRSVGDIYRIRGGGGPSEPRVDGE